KKISKEAKGDLLVETEIEGTRVSAPKAFYPDGTRLKTGFNLTGRTMQFSVPEGYDKNRAIIIDPFISSTNVLFSPNFENNGVAKDIDFDYDGNIYVSGGGNAQNY